MTAEIAQERTPAEEREDLKLQIRMLLGMKMHPGDMYVAGPGANYDALRNMNTDMRTRILARACVDASNGDAKAREFLFKYAGYEPPQEQTVNINVPRFIDDFDNAIEVTPVDAVEAHREDDGRACAHKGRRRAGLRRLLDVQEAVPHREGVEGEQEVQDDVAVVHPQHDEVPRREHAGGASPLQHAQGLVLLRPPVGGLAPGRGGLVEVHHLAAADGVQANRAEDPVQGAGRGAEALVHHRLQRIPLLGLDRGVLRGHRPDGVQQAGVQHQGRHTPGDGAVQADHGDVQPLERPHLD